VFLRCRRQRVTPIPHRPTHIITRLEGSGTAALWTASPCTSRKLNEPTTVPVDVLMFRSGFVSASAPNRVFVLESEWERRMEPFSKMLFGGSSCLAATAITRRRKTRDFNSRIFLSNKGEVRKKSGRAICKTFLFPEQVVSPQGDVYPSGNCAPLSRTIRSQSSRVARANFQSRAYAGIRERGLGPQAESENAETMHQQGRRPNTWRRCLWFPHGAGAAYCWIWPTGSRTAMFFAALCLCARPQPLCI
jgi:hypothetical protein